MVRRAEERPDENFHAAGFCRAIGQPLAVSRQLTVHFGCRCFQHRNHFVIAERVRFDIPLRARRQDMKEQVIAVRRPAGWYFAPSIGIKNIAGTARIDTLDEEIARPFIKRCEGDRSAVG